MWRLGPVCVCISPPTLPRSQPSLPLQRWKHDDGRGFGLGLPTSWCTLTVKKQQSTTVTHLKTGEGTCVLLLHLTCDWAMQQTHPEHEVRRSRQVQLSMSMLERLLPDIEAYWAFTTFDSNPVNIFALLELIIKSIILFIFLRTWKQAIDF